MISSSVSRVRPPRYGYMLIEIGAAMVLLAMAMVVVMQLGYWSLRQRAQAVAEQVAIELAANVLEAARAQPWESLTSDWAASQQIPPSLQPSLPGGMLTVQIEPEESLTETKRVTAEIRWMLDEEIQSRPIRLEGLFTARSAPSAGGQR